MAKRRPSGDGMVRKRDDGRWEGRIVVGHKENGDPITEALKSTDQMAWVGMMNNIRASATEIVNTEIIYS